MAKMAFLAAATVGVIFGVAFGSRIDGGPRCEPIKIDMCKSIGYNMTGMPNLAQNTLQTDAMFDLSAYSLLILLGCANELQFFLCSVYAPMCVNEESNPIPQTLIGPCRPLCERVKRGCVGFFQDFNIPWPSVLECDKFPSTNIHDHMCMEGPGQSSSPAEPQLTSSLMNTMQANPFLINEVRRQLAKGIKHTEKYKTYKRFFDLFDDLPDQLPKKCSHLRKPEKYRYLDRTGSCVPECSGDISFTEEDKEFSRHWIIILSVLSLFLSFVSLITLLIDNYCGGTSRRTTVPSFASRGPPVFLTFCCFMYSLGYLVSQVLPRETYCIGDLAGHEGHRNSPCIAVFILTYFFGIATSGWWSASSISWFLSLLDPKRVPGGQTVSSLCHLSSWLPAAVLTIAGVITRQVEPDELSSVCFPGGATKDSGILYFILIPEGVYLVIGCVFYIVAVVSAFVANSEESHIELRPPRRRNLDLDLIKKLRARMGVFGILYILPKLCYFVTVVYEFTYRSVWLDASQQWLPKMEIFMLRIFMTLFIGMSCLWWIWRKDVVAAWGNCCHHISKSPKVETPPPNFYPNYPYHPQPQMDPNNITIIQDSSYQS